MRRRYNLTPELREWLHAEALRYAVLIWRGIGMPEHERSEPTADDLDECQPWDGERELPEWQDGPSDHEIGPTGATPD